jgi:anti-sigma regulatory factor (Ser/Thr protein kinase)/putative methionine-R-sulfoxide reductase with GAF domain
MDSRFASERLRDLQRVTDASLAYLELDELLLELLDRALDILDGDTAAILLLDDDGRSLVARAARGLEEEVERGVRIPVGLGFAGRIAAQREPVIVRDVDHADILNPILRERGVRSLLGVPLLVEARVIGVMHVGSLTLREFTEEDTDLLQSAGDRAALAIHGRLAEHERGLADAMQRSLLPPLPEVPGVTLAGRYLPAAADRLGGDWYDAFLLDDGRLGLAIGDVVGRGFRAAALMGQLRSGLRAYAMDSPQPGAVLARLSRLLRQLEPGSSATLLYMVLDLRGGRLSIAGAGHPPPLLLEPEGACRFVDLPPSAPLGTLRHPSYEQLDLPVDPGSTLLLYTDGLVERPDAPLDRGMARLRETMAERPREPEALCSAITEALLPSEPLGDDAALLAARTLPSSDSVALTLPAELDSLRVVRRSVERWLDGVGASREEVGEIALAACEACANSVEHAYAPGRAALDVRAEVTSAGDATVTIRDFGRWRPPRGRNRGRGIALMEGLMDRVEVTPGDDGTTVRLTRRLRTEPG